MNDKPSPKDWTEDFKYDNGKYQNECVECGSLFLGHKRRVFCKECKQGEKKATR